jgi:hypothetical protein
MSSFKSNLQFITRGVKKNGRTGTGTGKPETGKPGNRKPVPILV